MLNLSVSYDDEQQRKKISEGWLWTSACPKSNFYFLRREGQLSTGTEWNVTFEWPINAGCD